MRLVVCGDDLALAIDRVEAVPYRRVRGARRAGEDEPARRRDAADPPAGERVAAQEEGHGGLGPDDRCGRRRRSHRRDREVAAEVALRRARIPFEALRDRRLDEAELDTLD